MEGNTSNETNGSGTKRQQFTNKQRMDMYAFCVLELEMHSNKVSIKKQQQAIQKVLFEQQRDGTVQKIQQQESNDHHQLPTIPVPAQQQSHQQSQNQQQPVAPPSSTLSQAQQDQQPQQHHCQLNEALNQQNGESIHHATIDSNGCLQQQQQQQQQEAVTEGKTLLQLQEEVAMTRKCYSDYQKTQVLTSSMLRDVQARFSKYYPNSAIPSRTTIKHVFEKCIAHGTVENIKTPRKPTKLPQGDEIEYLLIHEPQLSLRQLAQKLNVSTGTVSRRCKALGLVPESVTIKHQQLATARRQKQLKQLEGQSTTSSKSVHVNNVSFSDGSASITVTNNLGGGGVSMIDNSVVPSQQSQVVVLTATTTTTSSNRNLDNDKAVGSSL